MKAIWRTIGSAGVFLSLLGDSELSAHEPDHRCPEELARKLRALEVQFGQLEAILLEQSEAAAAGQESFPQGPEPIEAKHLRDQVGILEAALRKKSEAVAADSARIANLESQITRLEALLEKLPAPADPKVVANLETRNRELQSLLEQYRATSARREKSHQVRVVGLEDEVAKLQEQLRHGSEARSMAFLEREVSELERLLRLEKPPSSPLPASPNREELSALREQVARLEGMLESSLKLRTTQGSPTPADNTRLMELEKLLAVLEERQRITAHSTERPSPATSVDDALTARFEANIARLEKLLAAAETRPRPAPDTPPARTRQRIVPPVPMPDSTPRRVILPKPRPKPVTQPAAANQGICATLRLRAKPDIPSPIDPHGPNFFGIFTYDVLDGFAAGQTIQVAHGVRWANRSTCVTTRKIGAELVLDVVPLWWYPQLKGAPIVGDGDRGMLYLPRLP